MTTNARAAGDSGSPVAASRKKTLPLSGSSEDIPLSPVQRMRQKISLADPDMVRRIIYDPALEP